MRFALILAAMISAFSADLARAQTPVVVELFTSQGCSSCPPADALLQELAGQHAVIALALHVDYWDYLGWRDEFAMAAFSARQSQYAHTWRQRTVYTPQMVVQGQEYMSGNHARDVLREIARAQSVAPKADLQASRANGHAVIAVSPVAGSVPSNIYLVRYLPSAEVDIERGENAGKRMTYVNVVRDWQLAAQWDGRSRVTITRDDLGDDPWVVIVQAGGFGPILAAADLR